VVYKAKIQRGFTNPILFFAGRAGNERLFSTSQLCTADEKSAVRIRAVYFKMPDLAQSVLSERTKAIRKSKLMI